MFTSRAEYRILLRQDNADIRLTPKSHEMGLASKERMDRVEEKMRNANEIIRYFREESIAPEEINPILDQLGSSPVSQKLRMFGILARPGVSIYDFVNASESVKMRLSQYCREDIEQAEILMKYDGYTQRKGKMADNHPRLDHVQLDEDLNYHQLTSLSSEAREKLTRIRPSTLGQASRISGISPADISVLMVYMGR